jgi:hypothetical protein
MSDWIDLDRIFVPLDEASEALTTATRWFTPANALTWEEVLKTPCVVVLGEAGSGKTTELRAQAERLHHLKRAAFFAPIELLAKDGLDTAVEGDPAAFEAWKDSSEPAWFFLDSVDEAKLHGESLERAIAKFDKALRNQLGRCHLVVSSRHSDWRIQDKDCLRRLVPRLAPLPVEAPQEPRSRQRFRRPQGGRNSGDSPAAALLHVLQLASLSRDQIRLYAERAADVRDVDAFMNALSSADLWGLAGRPLDVSWLATYWKRRGEFGPLRDMIEEGVQEKLAETKLPALYQSRISLKEAREGVERLALVLTMTGIDAVALPAASSHESGYALDARKVLASWSDDKILDLLRRSLFDPATYGRVRIHHRAVREYLAASCLKHLRQRAMGAEELDRLLFGEMTGRRFIRRGFEPVVAWLALDDANIRRRAVDIAPEHLMDLGDPSLLPPEARRDVLRSYATRFAGRKRTMHYFDPPGLQRFAHDDAAPLIRELLEQSQPENLRGALLTMIERGKLYSLADTALRVAKEQESPQSVRCRAIDAVSAVGTSEHKRELIDVLLPRCGDERDTAQHLLDSLFPVALTIDEVVSILESVKPNGFWDGYTTTLGEMAKRCPPETRAELLTKLIRLFECILGSTEGNMARHFEWAPLVVALLDEILRSGSSFSALSGCLRLIEKVSESRGTREGAAVDVSLSKHPHVRRAAFWEAVERTRARNGSWPRRSWDVDLDYTFRLTDEDADWIERDAIERPDAPGRLLAFDALADVLKAWSTNNGEVWRRLKRVSETSRELGKRMERWRNQPFYPPYSAGRSQWHLSPSYSRPEWCPPPAEP